jgi:hypothetical protein
MATYKKGEQGEDMTQSDHTRTQSEITAPVRDSDDNHCSLEVLGGRGRLSCRQGRASG